MANKIREIDYSDMVKSCDGAAKERFKQPAYSGIVLSEQARKMIRAQGEQMISKGVDAGE